MATFGYTLVAVFVLTITSILTTEACDKACQRERVSCTNKCRIEYLRNRREFLECSLECKEDYQECCECFVECDQEKTECLMDCRDVTNPWERRECTKECRDELQECKFDCP
ncbi:uncharacterized protein LOC125674925 [Ostrea edulis]|uniref:uncharacterized protein LOC125674925 n=1 Tax=Ostrea edulis TaxID=37623 RepID=UPI002094E9E1|nr:uncharacterized protein LOC125674925 [Ostrea edulis]